MVPRRTNIFQELCSALFDYLSVSMIYPNTNGVPHFVQIAKIQKIMILSFCVKKVKQTNIYHFWSIRHFVTHCGQTNKPMTHYITHFCVRVGNARVACMFIRVYVPVQTLYTLAKLIDVLWGQPIKLIQVFCTSEFHEY